MTAAGQTRVLGMAGCGAMGLPMAERLLAAGFEVWGFDVRPASEFGAFTRRMIADPAEFAARVDCVFSVVRDRRQTMDLCFDQQAVFAAENPPGTLVLCSTLSPRVIPEVAAKLPVGTDLLDAPMSGAPHRARNGTLTFMVGGSAASVAALARPFEAMGERIHHLGERGTGMTVKVINNFVASASVVAVRRALKAGEALGVDGRVLLDVMRTSSGGTWYGDHFDDIDWAGEGYDPENTMGILEKDMTSFLDALQSAEGVTASPFEDAVLQSIRRTEPVNP